MQVIDDQVNIIKDKLKKKKVSEEPEPENGDETQIVD